MITSKDANALEGLSYTIHTQILRDHGNTPDAAHLDVLRAFHHLLASMVNAETPQLHGKWALSLSIGMGKTSGIVAFIVAARMLGLLTPTNSPISLTVTAARIVQLFDFERMLLDNGIPKAELRSLVSVIHDNPAKAQRESDENKGVPILLVAHNRVRQVYHRRDHRRERDMCYFLKYGAGRRDLIIWDEAVQLAESVSILWRDIRQSIDSLASRSEVSHVKTWLDTKMLELEGIKSTIAPSTVTLLSEDEGIISFSADDKTKAATYYTIVAGLPGLLLDARANLLKFLELFRFTMRVIPSSQPGIASFNVVLPDMDNFISLDAGFVHNKLAQLDQSIRNPESDFPMLQEILTRHKKGSLAELKDCSSQTVYHWNHGAGKDVVAKDLHTYLDDSATSGNVIVEVLTQIKHAQEQGDNVLVWTHLKHNGRALEPLVKRACKKFVGLNTSPSRLLISHYGQHDSRNDLQSYSVVFHVGIQERHAPDLAGSILGCKRDMRIALPKKYLLEAKLTDKAVVFMQSTGRGPSRTVTNGKSAAQTSYVIFSDTPEKTLEGYIKKCLPQCQWKAWPLKTVSRLDEAGLMQTVQESIQRYLDTLPNEVERVSSRQLKRELKAEKVARMTWARAVQAVCGNSPNRHKSTLMGNGAVWLLVGQSLVRETAKAKAFGFKGEIAQAAA